jgi:hypothetical protein
VRDFVKDHGINYRCALGNDEIFNQVPEMEGFPTTLFIDRKGIVRMKLTGLYPYAAFEYLVVTLLEETNDR